MAHLNEMLLGRNLNGEQIAEILNIAKLTLANAAVAVDEPIRKGEYDTAAAVVDGRLTAVEGSALHLDAVYIDETSVDLATAVAAATYADGVWTFSTQELSEGDLLIP